MTSTESLLKLLICANLAPSSKAQLLVAAPRRKRMPEAPVTCLVHRRAPLVPALNIDIVRELASSVAKILEERPEARYCWDIESTDSCELTITFREC